jgi:hypothetical protein
VTSWEKDELLLALSMRVCFLETGDPVLRAVDVHERLASAGISAEERRVLTAKLKPLGSRLMRHILQLEELIGKISKAKVSGA